MTDVSARLHDDDLAEWYEDRENKSETVRKALRYLRLKEDGVDDDRLTDDQRAAYRWLRENVGVGESVSLGPAKSKLAAQVGIQKEDLRTAVLHPLNRCGYIHVETRMRDVRIRVRPPDAAENDVPDASRSDSVEEVGERMDALDAAEPEAAD